MTRNEMEETNSGYRAIRIGDPSDWRLVMVIGAGGIETYLRNVENPMDEVEILFREEWDGDTSTLLERVESAVYDHPQLLDDFAADIAIETPKALWIPEKIVERGRNRIPTTRRRPWRRYITPCTKPPRRT